MMASSPGASFSAGCSVSFWFFHIRKEVRGFLCPDALLPDFHMQYDAAGSSGRKWEEVPVASRRLTYRDLVSRRAWGRPSFTVASLCTQLVMVALATASRLLPSRAIRSEGLVSRRVDFVALAMLAMPGKERLGS